MYEKILDTLPNSTAPTLHDTFALSPSNQEDFIKAYSERIEGLRSTWKSWQIFEGLPDTCFRLPLVDFIDKKISKYLSDQNYKPYLPDTTIYDYWTKSLWRGRHRKIKNFAKVWECFESAFRYDTHSEEEKYIQKYNLQPAIEKAFSLIEILFEKIKVDTQVYVDQEEPEYDIMNINLHLSKVKEDDIEKIVDKYEELQAEFLESVDPVLSSKICFYLDISE